jgi:hypothetical protein
MNKITARQITILTTILYFFAGNIVGYSIYTSAISSESLLFYLFIPYTFTWTLCSLVGFDWLAFVFLAAAYLFTLALFYPICLYYARPKQDFKNSAFRKYLNFTQTNKEQIKNKLKAKNTNILPETIDQYFVEFEELYNSAESILTELYKTKTEPQQYENSFRSVIADKYIWLDKSNQAKLYDTCSFYLR